MCPLSVIRMRTPLVLVALFLTVSVASAQDRAYTPEQMSQYRVQIQQQLLGYKHGEFLYRNCDIFRKVQERRAEVALGWTIAEAAADIDVHDTNIVGDITRSSSDENETSIAINRNNPNLIVAGANDAAMYNVGMPIYCTSNAGQTWRTYRMPGLRVGTCVPGGDPILVAGPDSTMYYVYLIYDNDVLQGSPGISDLIVARSTNGKLWVHGRPVMNKTEPEATFEDKESMAVDLDPTSPHYGRIYLSWVHYNDNFGSQYLTVSWSDDKGDSWSAPKYISDSTGYFSVLRVGANGTVFISSSSTEGNNAHWFMVSHDGGQSFQPHLVTEYIEYPINVDARPSLKGDHGFRAFPYTSFDVDRATNALYLTYGTWDDDSYAAVYATKSSDDGRTWQTPTRIGSQDASQVDHFLPWVTFDQVRRRANVAFYSSEDDPENLLLRFNYVDFDSLSTVHPLGNDTFDPLTVTRGGLPFIGDYVGADSYNGYFAAAWTENRKSHTDGDVYAFVRSPITTTRSVQQINAISYSVSDAYPSPSVDGKISFNVESPTPLHLVVNVYDAIGRSVHTEAASIDAGDRTITLHLPTSITAGAYRVVFNSDGEALERSIVFGVQ